MVLPGGVGSTSGVAVVRGLDEEGEGTLDADAGPLVDQRMTHGLAARPRPADASGPWLAAVLEPDDPISPPDAGLGPDGLPRAAGMVMAAAWLQADEGERWGVLGFDSGRVTCFRPGPLEWEEGATAAGGAVLSADQACVSSVHAALHSVTAVATQGGSSIAVGTAADFVILLSAEWEAVEAERGAQGEAAAAAASAGAAGPSASGLGSLLAGGAPALRSQHCRLRRPALRVASAVRLPRAGVSAVAFAKAGAALVSCGWDGKVRVFDVAAGLSQAACLDWHRCSVYSLSVADAGDASGPVRMASGDKEGRIAVWSLPL